MKLPQDENVNKSTMLDIPLLSLDRVSVPGKTTLSHWEENRNHFVKVVSGPHLIDQVFEGWSAKIALDAVRESFEKENLLIAVEGALVYAVYSGMCHDMRGGYHGYNFKNRELGDKTIPASVSTFKIVGRDEYPFVSSLAEQKEYQDHPDKQRGIITKLEKPKTKLMSLFDSLTRKNK